MKLLPVHPGILPTLPSNCLYCDPAFVDVVTSVYHPGRDCRLRDYAVGGNVFRLIEVDGAGPVVTQTFIDFHQSIARLAAQGPRLATLPRLPGAALGLQRLDEFQQQPGWEESQGAPTVRWQGFATWQDYLALLQSRRVLSEDRRRGRRLGNAVGELEFRVHDDALDVLPTCFDWKSGRDLSLARPALFADPRHGRFFHELSARGMLRASTLRGGGQLLAIWLGAVHRAHWSGWVFAFNPAPELRRFSLGRQLLYRMLEESHRSRHEEFDFSIGLEPYKLNFATHVRPIGLAGSPAPMQRAAQAARDLLARYPRLHDTARALRRRLAPRTVPETTLSSGEP
jgi:Acetyltransferase (GNAT) domain